MHIPWRGFPQVCFIRNTVRNPNILVGEYTYYDDPEDAEDFERNVLYHFPFIGDRLVIGRFCAIARGVRFIMNGANHAMAGISTYPFWIFGNGWEVASPAPGDLPHKGDTVVGNDVVANVAPYTIVGGNPARPIRQRFDDATIARLLEVAWWDWPVERITAQLRYIVAGDVAVLESEGWAGAGERGPEGSRKRLRQLETRRGHIEILRKMHYAKFRIWPRRPAEVPP